MITFITTAYKENIDAYMFLSSLLLQKDNRWECIIAIDGENKYITTAIDFFNDPRIKYIEFKEPKGYWGHYNRKYVLEHMVTTEFIIQTSIQDYFLPNTTQQIIPYINDFDFIYYDSIHNHMDYNILSPELRVNRIDWGNFAIRTNIALEVKIDNLESSICDGLFVEKCLKYPNLKINKINKILTIHN